MLIKTNISIQGLGTHKHIFNYTLGWWLLKKSHWRNPLQRKLPFLPLVLYSNIICVIEGKWVSEWRAFVTYFSYEQQTKIISMSLKIGNLKKHMVKCLKIKCHFKTTMLKSMETYCKTLNFLTQKWELKLTPFKLHLAHWWSSDFL